MSISEPLRVLVVEDDPLVSFDVAGVLNDAGFEVVGPFSVSAPAMRVIAFGRADVAALDLGLRGETSVQVADALAHAGVPFVWLSGYSQDEVPRRHKLRPFVSKPFSGDMLLGALVMSLGSVSLTASVQPYWPGSGVS